MGKINGRDGTAMMPQSASIGQHLPEGVCKDSELGCS